MVRTVLHVLSQRPSLTGSGITLDAFVRLAAPRWEQHVVVGVPAEDPQPEVGGLPPERIHPLRFETEELPFPLPGMSDVMPYRSTVWSTMTPPQLDRYRAAWRFHLGRVLADVRPDVIHVHHVWLLAALLRSLAPGVPIVNQCHATGLRQAVLFDRAGELPQALGVEMAAVVVAGDDLVEFQFCGLVCHLALLIPPLIA